MNGRDLVETIKTYGEDAKDGKLLFELAACPRCKGQPVCFKRHGVRPRLFLVFAQEVVRRVCSHLTRWKCPLCGRTFTTYPEFTLPFKRYVLPFILGRCAAYVADKARTYQEGVGEDGSVICHEDAESGSVLWPSTLWRWVDRLGRFPLLVRQALGLIKQKDPSTDIFRALGRPRIREDKFRSEGRKIVLKHCGELVAVDQEYARLFGVSVFPELATGCGFT